MMADKLDKIEKALKIQPAKDINGSDSTLSEPNKKLMRHPTVQLISDKVEEKEPVIPTKKVKQSVKFESQEKDEDNDWENPYWIQNHPENKKKCPLLVKAKEKKIKEKEVQFWKDMINEYLKPLDEDKEEKKKISEGLRELKNGVSLSFMLMNVMWVTAIYMLQAKKDALGLKWPLGEKGPIISFDTTNVEKSNLMILEYEYLELEPVGMVFMIAFILIMFIQLVGMVLHRLMTLGHIVASTHIGFLKGKKFDSEEYLNAHGVDVIKEIQDTLEMDKDGTTLEEAVEQTIKNITSEDDDTKRRLSRTSTIKNLHRADTISALKRKQNTYGQRKETVRRRTLKNKRSTDENVPSTIMEDDETDLKVIAPSGFNVRRTESKMDPDGMEFREV